MFHATLSNRLLSNKKSFQVFIPLWIWMFLFFILFFPMVIIRYYILVPVLAIEFFCIIPVIFLCKRNMKKALEELNDTYQADLEVKDGIVFINDIPLHIYQDPNTQLISLKHTSRYGKYYASALDFFAIMDAKDTDLFLDFCKENNVRINKFKGIA